MRKLLFICLFVIPFSLSASEYYNGGSISSQTSTMIKVGAGTYCCAGGSGCTSTLTTSDWLRLMSNSYACTGSGFVPCVLSSSDTYITGGVRTTSAYSPSNCPAYSDYSCSCNSGYYLQNQGTSSCYCAACPSHSFGSPATPPGAAAIGNCYIPGGTGSDEYGIFTYSDCPYY